MTTKKIKPRNRRLARLSLRWMPDIESWALVCGGAVIQSVAMVSEETARKSARAGQKWQWSMYRIATELTFYNKDGTPAKGPGSRTTWPRSADPRRSRG